ncbi:MAG TPA: hypothetical protein DEG23_01980 [Coxiellaceae bacterium]|nr:hypothetical protein [Coxiellaceae bacterium]HBY55567.1 hypothetical protein [Coxiellaceae bacterium]
MAIVTVITFRLITIVNCRDLTPYRIFLLKVMFAFFMTTTSWGASTPDVKPPAQLASDSAICKHQKKEDVCAYIGNAKFIQGATHLEAEQITIYRTASEIKKIVASGNAKFIQDTTHLEAEQITIHRKASETKKIVASGKDSSYSATTDDNQQLKAVADLITIDPNKHSMILEKNGQLFIGQDKYKGPYIDYKFK